MQPNFKRTQLDLSNLPKFGHGHADAIFRKLLRSVVADCMDRGMDGKPRELTLTMVIVPIPEESGCTEANVHCKLSAKLPAHVTTPKPTVMHKQGQLSFSEHAPDNPEQSTLMDGTEG